jgi:hypothetical protein
VVIFQEYVRILLGINFRGKTMKVLFSLFALLILASTTTAQAQECVPQSEMQAIASHFKQYANLAGSEYCFNDSEESHLIAGLVFMRKTKFEQAGRSPDDLFSGKFANDWWGYFIGRISKFEIDKGCPKGVIAYVYMFGGSTMYACSAAMTDNFTAMDLASVFMHEARHMDGFPHITCSQGPRQGLSGACDQRISDGGSYAITVETYSQLAKYALDIHPALKAYARSSSIVYADEAFQTPVAIKRTQRFMVMANNKQFHTVDTSGATQTLGNSPELGKIYMRAQHMILIPNNVNSNARYVFARGEGEIASQAGDQANEYNALPPGDRSNLVDIHVAAQWNARVYKNKIRFNCDPRSPNVKELSLAEAPVGMIYPNGYDRGARTAQLMTESGKVYDLGCSGGNPQLQFSSFTFDRKYKSMYKVGGLILGLTMDGFVREIQGTTSRPFALGGLDGNIYELMPNQAIDFYTER